MSLSVKKDKAAFGRIIPASAIARRNWYRLLLAGLGILTAMLISSCDRSNTGQPRSPVNARETSAMPKPGLKKQVAQPPIDRRIAPATATATFALG